MKAKFSLFLLYLCITSCATVSFYEEPKLTNETGLKFYHSKPYLLVEKSPQKDVQIKSTIIYLPDLENATYAKIKPGLGSADLKMDLENGILKSYGLVTDTKIPETITSVAGALTSTGILGDEATEELAGEETEQQSADEEKVKLLMKIEPDVKLALEDLKSLKITQPSEIAIRDSVQVSINKILEKISEYNPEKIKEIAKGLRDNAKKILSIKSTADTDEGKKLNDILDKINKNLIKAADTIDKPKSQNTTWELYEIKMNEGKTELIKVEVGTQ